MRNLLVALVGGIILGALALWALDHFREQPATDTGDLDAQASESNRSGIVQLSAEQQTKAGITVAPLESRELAREVKGYGHVIDLQPFFDLMAELRSAEAAQEASTKEYARVQALHTNDQNASARTVETAAAAVKRDQIQLEAIRTKLRIAWGTAFCKSDTARPVPCLTSLDAVIQVDLPPGESLPSPPATARVQSPFDATRSAEARLLGPATTASANSPGQGLLFLLQSNSLELRPEMGVVAFLALEGPRLRGVVLPRSAIVRHQGQTWVFVQTDDQTFERRPVVLEHVLDEGWFIEATAAPTGNIVVSGAQTLLSEELRSQINLAD